MLKRLITTVRRQPKAVRDQYALWIAIMFTAIIVLVWVVNVPDRFTAVETAQEATEEAEEQTSFSEMMSGLREEISALNASSSVATSTPTTATTTLPPVTPPSGPEVRIATFTTPVASSTP